jgi:hypothetical protein
MCVYVCACVRVCTRVCVCGCVCGCVRGVWCSRLQPDVNLHSGLNRDGVFNIMHKITEDKSVFTK